MRFPIAICLLFCSYACAQEQSPIQSGQNYYQLRTEIYPTCSYGNEWRYERLTAKDEEWDFREEHTLWLPTENLDPANEVNVRVEQIDTEIVVTHSNPNVEINPVELSYDHSALFFEIESIFSPGISEIFSVNLDDFSVEYFESGLEPRLFKFVTEIEHDIFFGFESLASVGGFRNAQSIEEILSREQMLYVPFIRTNGQYLYLQKGGHFDSVTDPQSLRSVIPMGIYRRDRDFIISINDVRTLDIHSFKISQSVSSRSVWELIETSPTRLSVNSEGFPFQASNSVSICITEGAFSNPRPYFQSD